MDQEIAARKEKRHLLTSPSPRGFDNLLPASSESFQVEIGDDTELTNIFNNSPNQTRQKFSCVMSQFPEVEKNLEEASATQERIRSSTPLPRNVEEDERSSLIADPVARTLSEEKPRIDKQFSGLSIRKPLAPGAEGPAILTAMPNTTSPRIASKYATASSNVSALVEANGQN